MEARPIRLKSFVGLLVLGKIPMTFKLRIYRGDWVRVKTQHEIQGRVTHMSKSLVTFLVPAYSPVWGVPYEMVCSATLLQRKTWRGWR